MTIDYHSRRSKVYELLASRKLDSCVILGLENLRFLSGFTGTAGALVLGEGFAAFLTDSRYVTQAHSQVNADLIIEYKQPAEGIVAQLKARGGERIGFEGALSYQQVQDLREKGGAGWTWDALNDELTVLRAVKSDVEIALMREAARLNAEAFGETLSLIRPGVSEREVALQLEFALKKRGAEEKAFDFIVASGERGALPHGVASDRLLQDGELVTIDFGCRVNGYHSDETVTLALGEPPAVMQEVYAVVLEAHDRAIEAVAPGIALAELDHLARNVIQDAGYGEYFGHGLGHGVGLNVHEQPTVSPRSRMTAAEGMVITIEPGIYLPDQGGVRIEDMVLVTAEGSSVLTTLPKQYRNIATC